MYNKGLMTEQDYPYKAIVSIYHFNYCFPEFIYKVLTFVHTVFACSKETVDSNQSWLLLCEGCCKHYKGK